MNNKRNKTITAMDLYLSNQFHDPLLSLILNDFHHEFNTLALQHHDQNSKIRQHTFLKIYPAVSLYHSLQYNGIPRSEAWDIVADYFYSTAQDYADSMKKMLTIPGLYKLMPLMWKIVTRSQFGTKAGFLYYFYNVGNRRVKFDMTQCTYCKYFKEEGCPELISIFCHMDDIQNEDLHPKLLWNRTKTMGNGDELCDFDLIVKD